MKNDKIFIIAEAGVNHNWDINLAYKLIDIAKECWADAVKFQTFKAEGVVTKEWKMAEYQKNNIWKSLSQLDMIKKFELKFDDFWKLKEYCDKIGIMFLSSPHSGKDSIDYLYSIWVPYLKFWSWELTNLPILRYAARKWKPIILWTGMATMDEVRFAVNNIKDENNNVDISLLHCTTNYPCPFNEVNLGAMISMIKEFPKLTIWYSDHTLWWEVPVMAAYYWAKIIEKHFTISKDMEWPDHKASASPEELKDIIEKIRYIEQIDNKENRIKENIGDNCWIIMWSYEKKPNESEIKIMPQVRKSIVAAHNLEKWHILTDDDLLIKRPIWWIEPKYYYEILGKETKTDIKEDQQITFNDLI